MVIKIICLILTIIIIAMAINIYEYRKQRKNTLIKFKVPMTLTGLPIVQVKSNGVDLNFLLDTGANISVIDTNILSKLKYIKEDSISEVFGIEGNRQSVETVSIEFNKDTQSYKDIFQVMDMSAPFGFVEIESGIKIHGILGNEFLAKYGYILDFKNLEAYTK